MATMDTLRATATPSCGPSAGTADPSTPPSGSTSTADLVFRTKLGPKTARIVNDPRVQLRVCDYKGRVPASAVAFDGHAELLSGAEAERANQQLHARYGWQYNLVPLLPLPGITNVDAGLPWRRSGSGSAPEPSGRAALSCGWS